MSSENIFSDTRCLYIFAKIYGFISFKINSTKTGKKYLTYQRWHFLFSIGIQVIVGLCGYITMKNTYEKDLDYKISEGLFFILDIITKIAFVTVCFVYCLWNKIYVKDNQTFWQELYATEEYLSKFNVILDHKYLRTATSFGVILTALFSYVPNIIIAFFNRRHFTRVMVFTMAFYYQYVAMAYGMTICQLLLYFAIVGDMLGKLEESTEKKFLNTNQISGRLKPTYLELVQIAKCHQQICYMAREANRIISVQLLFLCMYVFCFCTTSAFNSMLSIVINSYNIEDLMVIGWVILSIGAFILSVGVSHNCMQKVRQYSTKFQQYV